jgi:hypothetical protein
MEDKTLPKPRPTLVTLLAVITIIGVVFTFGLAGLKELIPELARNDVPLPVWVTATTFLMVLGKLVAAIFLLRMRRIGFFLYATFESISAILSIIGGKIGMDYLDSSFINPDFPIDPKVMMLLVVGFGIGLSILFIGGHASHLSKMD